MLATTIAMFAFFILLGFEVRYRFLKEDVAKINELLASTEEEIIKLKAEIKLKRNIYEDNNGLK